MFRYIGEVVRYKTNLSFYGNRDFVPILTSGDCYASASALKQANGTYLRSTVEEIDYIISFETNCLLFDILAACSDGVCPPDLGSKISKWIEQPEVFEVVKMAKLPIGIQVLSSLYKLFGIYYLQPLDRLLLDTSSASQLAWMCHNRPMLEGKDSKMFMALVHRFDLLVTFLGKDDNMFTQTAITDIIFASCLPFAYLFYQSVYMLFYQTQGRLESLTADVGNFI